MMSSEYWPIALPDGPQSVTVRIAVGNRVGDVVQQAQDGRRSSPLTVVSRGVAVIDVAGFVAELKSHAIDHGFHVHDERHFVETYSLRQLWEVDLHPEEACNGPIDLHLSLEVDPRALLGFEDEVIKQDDPDADPPRGFTFPLLFTWTLPPLPEPPDLLVLATEIAGVGGLDLAGRGVGDRLVRQRHRRPGAQPVDGRPHRRSISPTCCSARRHPFCETLDRCKEVSLFLLEQAPGWLGRVVN